MAQFDARKEGAVSPEFLRTSRVTDPRAVTVISEQTLLSGQAAQFVFRAPGGSVVALGGIDGAALRELVDQTEHIPDDRRAGQRDDGARVTLRLLEEIALDRTPVLASSLLKEQKILFQLVGSPRQGAEGLQRHLCKRQRQVILLMIVRHVDGETAHLMEQFSRSPIVAALVRLQRH